MSVAKSNIEGHIEAFRPAELEANACAIQYFGFQSASSPDKLADEGSRPQ
jgi:hypothetical protein